MQIVSVLVFPLLLSCTITALDELNAVSYLSKYGYIPPSTRSSTNLIAKSSYKKAIEEFQSFVGLEVTGELDINTQTMMMRPRCGVKDILGTGYHRTKRYLLHGSRWRVRDLTYKISKYPSKLSPSEVDKEIQRAFDVWAGYTDLRFVPKSGLVHIEVVFHNGSHGDDDQFDGPKGILAHAYIPTFGGDAHFDASEAWSVNSYNGTNLFQVAAHEFGHSLGLTHTDVTQALMAPIYRGYDPVFRLDTDDIEGIQTLYGKKTMNTNPDFDDDDDQDIVPSETPNYESTSPDQSLCNDPKFDTIFNSAEGYTYVFKGDEYWKLTEASVAPGYPKLISDYWIGLPGNIDASFTYKNGKTYFFKGSKYWRYKGTKVDGFYPKEISRGFPGVPDDLDAALAWDGIIYFYKGSQYWRFKLWNTYPEPISYWFGVPSNLDAAFQWTNGYTYFFKENAYYRFNDSTLAVDAATPSFPRSSAYWWFGCKDAHSGTIGTSDSTIVFIDEESS